MTEVKWCAKHLICLRMTHFSKKLHCKGDKSQPQTWKGSSITGWYGPYMMNMLLCLRPQTSQPQKAAALCTSARNLNVLKYFSLWSCVIKLKCATLRLLDREYFWLSGQVKIDLLACICVSFCLVFWIWQLHVNISLQCVLGTSREVTSTEGILKLKNRKGRKCRSHFNFFKKSWDHPHSQFFQFNVKIKTFIIIMGILQLPS